MVLTLHHLNASRSQRILWLLEELEVPYEIKKYEREATKQAPKALKEVHPIGKSPIITDGDITLPESGAIVEYIIKKYGEGKVHTPTEGKALADELYYKHSAEGSLMPPVVNQYIGTLVPAQTPFFIRPVVNMLFDKLNEMIYKPAIQAQVAIIDEHLGKNEWFAGGDAPTAADYMMIFPLEGLPRFGQSTPNIDAYVARVQKRPAYRRAIERGGPYPYDYQSEENKQKAAAL
ncbi:thioredoxin-like protein [Schizophyllum commune H4-8]|uniref:glutathione transferase n=1 Tax=Schizophyllum commune (strain H4-8 / FGSC 9210) TaxID=578458 RepID=D8Q124_SCHCM|nr:thioredoxin-like protein [Schizophyllum commune H4-8]KAI5895242.1 thioredoxin-like protein [Schizophyllum commune H4-8]